MKILYMVNGLSTTSIPWRWSEYFNTHTQKSVVKLISVKQFRDKFFKVESKIDVVHGHHIKAMALFLMTNFMAKRASVYTVHGSYLFLSKINAMLLKFIFKASDKIIFVNQMLYDVLPQSYKALIAGKYEVVLNGVESDYDYKKSDVYSKFHVDKESIVTFHPARFVTEKNHIRLISAFKPLIDQNPKIILLLAGDGKLKKEIVDHIALLQLEKNVRLLGLIERDEVYSFLERCDLFLMPSISEGLNIAFLEAISMKTKIVVSDIEQFTYPLKAYGLEPKMLNVTFVDPLDEAAMSQGIFESLQDEKSLSYNGSDFSLNSMMEKYKTIYGSLVNEKVES